MAKIKSFQPTDTLADTNITPKMKADFTAVTDGSYNNIALFSCFLDGKPTAAIVAITNDGGKYQIFPLFVAVTDDMRLTDHDGNETKGD